MYQYSVHKLLVCIVFITNIVNSNEYELADTNSSYYIDDLLRVYDPKRLLEIWTVQNDRYDMSLGCKKDFATFLEGVAEAKPWAFKMVDATGQYTRGIYWGNRYWVGSADLCRDLDNQHQESVNPLIANGLDHDSHAGIISRDTEVTGNMPKPRTRTSDSKRDEEASKKLLIEHAPPFRVGFSAVVLQINVANSSVSNRQMITLGICLPRICNVSDIAELMGVSAAVTNQRGTQRRVIIVKVRLLHGLYNYYDDPKFYIILCASIAVASLMIFGSIYDIKYLNYYGTQSPSTPSLSVQDNEDQLSIVDLTKNALNDASFVTNTMNRPPVAETKTINNNQNNLSQVNNGKKTEDISTISLDIIAVKANGNDLGQLSLQNDNLLTSHQGRIRISPFNANPLGQFLVAFSVPRNMDYICAMNVGEDTLAPVHGLKLISLLWVIMVHTCLTMFQVSDNKVFRAQAEKNVLYQTLSNGTYSVDTFFFLSGLLVSFLYCRALSKYNIRELITKDGVIGQVFQFVTLILYRFIRLTPPYLMVIGLIEISMKWYYANSILEFPARDDATCAQYWWRNALYINTFYPLKERCMSWSWYLANDAQFYTFGVLILMLTAKYVRWAAVTIGVFFATSWSATAFISVRTEFIVSIQDPFSHYEDLYDKPWTRIGPYLVGMCTGWFLCRCKCQLRIPKVLLIIGWPLATCCMVFIVYGLYWVQLGPWSSAAYVSLSHSAWALSIAFVIVACVTGHGGPVNAILSWRYFYPWSRLSYCAYLVHPALMRSMVLAADVPVHLTFDFLAVSFFGFLVTSYMSAFVLSLAFEAPAVALLRLAHPIRRKKKL